MANKPDGVPESIDLEALGLDHLAHHARTATFAPNWKSVLAADSLAGIVVIAAGIGCLWWFAPLGWVLIAIGVGYVALVLRRAMQWRYLRQQAGL